MSYGHVEQRCQLWQSEKPWKRKGRSGYSKWLKKAKARCERRRAKVNPECEDRYKRYRGWEY